MADELLHTKKLESVGFTRRQAEAQVEIIRDYADTKFATKQDLKDLAAEMHSEFRSVDHRFDLMKKEFELLRKENSRLADKVTIRLGSMIGAAVAILAALKFL